LCVCVCVRVRVCWGGGSWQQADISNMAARRMGGWESEGQ